METEIAKAGEKPGAAFMRRATAAAAGLLDQWVGPERAGEAKGRIAAAFQAAAMAAKDPTAFYESTPASVAQCVAIAALTGIMPSTGAAALAYLVPRRPRRGEAPQLQYQLSHRGLAALARRAGLTLIAVPVGHGDLLHVEHGEAVQHEPDIDNPPTTWDELRGVVVVVRDTRAGVVIFRGWVPRKLIAERRERSDGYRFASEKEWAAKSDPWHVWPVEMAMKTAMHYAVSRGWAVIDDTEAVRALSVDAQGDLYEPRTEITTSQPTTGHAALGLPAPVDVPEVLEPEPAFVRELGDESEVEP